MTAISVKLTEKKTWCLQIINEIIMNKLKKATILEKQDGGH